MRYINQQGSYLPMYKGRYKVSDYCQLVDKSTYPATQTVGGVTFTNNGDGSWTLNGTSTSQIYWDIINVWIQLNTSHKYLLLGCPKNESNDLFLYVNNGGALFDFDTGNGSIGTPTKNRGVITVAISNNISVNNAISKPQLFDLTEMYGAGNEPTTVEEFRQKFPDDLYPYSPYCWAKMKQMRYKVSDYCQLLDKSKYPATQTLNGVTFTNNGDGTITVDGTNTGNVRIFLPVAVNINLTDGHYYCMSGNAADWSANTYCTTFEIAGNGSDRDGEKIFKYTEPLNVIGTKNGFYIRISIGITVNNAIFKPQLFDLTEMYGAGNEPITVEEFRQKFPDDLYPYSPKCYLPLK